MRYHRFSVSLALLDQVPCSMSQIWTSFPRKNCSSTTSKYTILTTTISWTAPNWSSRWFTGMWRRAGRWAQMHIHKVVRWLATVWVRTIQSRFEINRDPNSRLTGTTKIFTDEELAQMIDPILETDDKNKGRLVLRSPVKFSEIHVCLIARLTRISNPLIISFKFSSRRIHWLRWIPGRPKDERALSETARAPTK